MNRPVMNKPVMNRPQDEPTVLNRPVMKRPVMKRPEILKIAYFCDIFATPLSFGALAPYVPLGISR